MKILKKLVTITKRQTHGNFDSGFLMHNRTVRVICSGIDFPMQEEAQLSWDIFDIPWSLVAGRNEDIVLLQAFLEMSQSVL